MLPASNSSTPAPSQPRTTFYRRQLPSATCVALSSPQGRAHFESALKSSHLKSFFPLIEQFTTQSDPAYCGVSTLVMVLNALSVDPRKVWKGPWRWYEESMLNCCVDLEKVKSTGITLPQLICLASCQGLAIQSTLQTKETDGNQTASVIAMEEFRKSVRLACFENKDEPYEVSSSSNGADNKGTMVADPLTILVVSYSRKILGQSGDGHFSPVGAYDPVSDSVLILDTARFKYGPHWVKLPLLWEAMQPPDPATGRPRGYVLLSFPGDDSIDQPNASDPMRHTTTTTTRPLQSVLFRSRMADFQVRRQYLDYLQSLRRPLLDNNSNEENDQEVTWDQVVSYWTKNGKDPKYIWQILTPQLTPIDLVERDAVMELRTVLNQVMKPYHTDAAATFPPDVHSCTGEHCRSNLSRTLCLTSHEAMFVVYLGSLRSEQLRHDIVYNNNNYDIDQNGTAQDEMNLSQTVRDQLLAEAELFRLALDVSDSLDSQTIESMA